MRKYFVSYRLPNFWLLFAKKTKLLMSKKKIIFSLSKQAKVWQIPTIIHSPSYHLRHLNHLKTFLSLDQHFTLQLQYENGCRCQRSSIHDWGISRIIKNKHFNFSRFAPFWKAGKDALKVKIYIDKMKLKKEYNYKIQLPLVPQNPLKKSRERKRQTGEKYFSI